MKTSTLKSVFAAVLLFFAATLTFAQNLSGLRIDVVGTTYSDQLWLFSVPTCTRGFDNGWDGYKMIGTNLLAPQIYAVEDAGNFQVDAVPDLNGTKIAFRPGQDNQYTLVFTTQYLGVYYQHLYLQDMLTNQTIDLLATPVPSFLFKVRSTDPLIRFQVVTSLPVISQPTTTTPTDTTTVTPTTPVDTTTVTPIVPADTTTVSAPATTTPVDTTTITPVPKDTTITSPTVPVETTTSGNSSTSDGSSTSVSDVTTDTPVVEGNDDESTSCTKNKHVNHKGDKPEKKTKLTIRNAGKTIIIENKGKAKGLVKVYNVMNGKVLISHEISPNGETTFESNVPGGTYIINGETPDDNVSVTVILK